MKKLKYELLIVLVFIAVRLPNLGHDTFNTDVWKWKARIYDFGSGVFNLNFAQTIQKYHPGVTLMWAGTTAVKVYNAYYDIFYKMPPANNSITTIFELNFVQKLFVVITIGITLAFVFYPLRKKFGALYALLFVLFILLEPFYLALTREIHLEGLMSTFMLASFVWLVYWLDEKKSHMRIFLSALFGSFAVLTKTSSLFLLPFTGLLLFLDKYLADRNFKKSTKTSLLTFAKWLGIFVLGFVVFWPAMWVAPLQALEAVYRGIFTIGVERGHEQFYFGKLVLDPGVTFYFVVLALKSSIYLIPGVIGALVLKKHLHKDAQKFITYALIFSILYTVQLVIPSKKLDRYLLPAMLSLSLISVFFYQWLFTQVKKVVFVLLLVPGIIVIALIHPDYFSYYNPIFGGLKAGIYVLEPKWLIGGPEIVAYFKNLKTEQGLESFSNTENIDTLIKSNALDNKLTVAFQEKYYTQVWPFIRELGGWAVIEDLSPYAVHTKYFVYPVWDDGFVTEDRFTLTPVGSIKVRGIPVYNVYQRND